MDNIINSPLGADFYIETELYDTSVVGGLIAISIHRRLNKGVCNTWKRLNGNWCRLLPERVSAGDFDKLLLAGELVRFSEFYLGQKGCKDVNAIRIIQSLANNFNEMIEK